MILLGNFVKSNLIWRKKRIVLGKFFFLQGLVFNKFELFKNILFRFDWIWYKIVFETIFCGGWFFLSPVLIMWENRHIWHILHYTVIDQWSGFRHNVLTCPRKAPARSIHSYTEEQHFVFLIRSPIQVLTRLIFA